MDKAGPYSLKQLSYQRIPSREVYIGDVPLGGNNPIRIQSMTTTDTMDTMATVEQTIRMVEAGCEYVRITAPSKKEAWNLAEIKKELRKRGYQVPLVADIHFTPNAAEIAARIVEKVRVNPGNYADKKRFKAYDYTDQSYQEELERIEKRFSPLVKICKAEGAAMRIGTNHGSLSDRIMSRYGDTPLGMVESAMEFVRICEMHGYYDIILSMKASNPQVMVQAYRMLMQQMIERNQVYPLHLGVTEAGEGEDGRIKSALGIATLLMDGIGDTVRVSLTEEPEYEAPVADFLVRHYVGQIDQIQARDDHEAIEKPFNPFEFTRRESREVLNLGQGQVPRVIADVRDIASDIANMAQIGYQYVPSLDKYNFADMAADFAYFGSQMPAYELPGGLKRIYDVDFWRMLEDHERNFPFFPTASDYLQSSQRSPHLNFVGIQPEDLDQMGDWAAAAQDCVFVLNSQAAIPTYDWRYMIYRLHDMGCRQPMIIKMVLGEAFPYYDDDEMPDFLKMSADAKTQLALSANGSSLLVDGLVDGIWMDQADDCRIRTAFGMLQLSRLRITKTEYISCPSCGRTLFDLQETTARIRKRTEHLKGVKIGIMGCIVNGPGEMADADYGYVGVGPGKISLYKGKEVVERGVKTEEAVDKLIELIRKDGRWIEPSPVGYS